MLLVKKLASNLKILHLTASVRQKGLSLTKTTQLSLMAAVKSKILKPVLIKFENKLKKQLLIMISEKLQERLAKLAGGVAVIKIGAATETEMKEKKARVEDALHATRAAVEEGVVPGGGVALIRASSALDSLKLEGDEAIGLDIIRRACEEPLRLIASNAGKEASVIANEVKKNKGAYGYNAFSDNYEDLIAAGVIDPTKVTRTALENASSIAGLILTTECIISEKPEKKEKMPAGGGMPGGGMDEY